MSRISIGKWIADQWRPPKARITGAVYLLYFLTAFFAAFLAGRGLASYGTAANLLAYAWYVALTLLFYEMFKPVDGRLSGLAALFGLAGCAIGTLELFHLAPSAMRPLEFFAVYCLLIGYLVVRSTFLPRILGVLMILAGLGWLLFLAPPVAKHFSTPIEALGIVAEGLLMCWLLVIGVNVQRWRVQARRS